MRVQHILSENGNMLHLQINDIHINQIWQDNNRYRLDILDEKLILNVFIPRRKYNFTKMGRVSAPRFTLRKQKDNALYRLRIKFNINIVLRNINNNLFSIRYISQRGITAKGSLIVSEAKITDSAKRLRLKS